MRTTFIFFFFFLFTGVNELFAEVKVPSIFASHMVLQQKSKIRLWGWCSPAEKINIKAGWDSTLYQTTGTGEAKWSITVQTPATGGPYTLLIKGENTILLEDILIGEVWLCGGQSNMEMTVDEAYHDTIEINRSANNSIRFFRVAQKTSVHPQDNVEGEWVLCTPESIRKFSAVAWYFGESLQKKLYCPVGLILACWGGTAAEVWTPAELVNNNQVLAKAAMNILPSPYWPVKPGAIFNAMIYPLTNFEIAGTIWYQGENNTYSPRTYQQLFTALIQGWRKQWQKEFPFYYVQIAPYVYEAVNAGALLREAQTQCLSLPKTGMVLTSDLVDDTLNVHPKKKKEVGTRLANYALAETYSLKGLAYKSPLYKNMQVEKNKIRLFFENAEGLESRNVQAKEFYIAGADKQFYPALATIVGNSVIISCKTVQHPVAVRYGFRNAARPDLFSKDGLPLNFFRTDGW